MGTRGSSNYHSGPRQCLQHLLKTEGPLGLTRGLKATIAREAPGNAIFFTVYEVNLVTVPATQSLLHCWVCHEPALHVSMHLSLFLLMSWRPPEANTLV